MKLVLRRVKVYAKLILILAAIVLTLVVVLKNQENTADIWFFKPYTDINVLWLILIIAVSSVVGWWGIRKIFGVLRELREVRRAAEADRRLQEQQRLARELAERERRIDAKVVRSIRQEPEEPSVEPPSSKAGRSDTST